MSAVLLPGGHAGTPHRGKWHKSLRSSVRFVTLSSRALGKLAWQGGRHSEKSLHPSPAQGVQGDAGAQQGHGLPGKETSTDFHPPGAGPEIAFTLSHCMVTDACSAPCQLPASRPSTDRSTTTATSSNTDATPDPAGTERGHLHCRPLINLSPTRIVCSLLSSPHLSDTPGAEFLPPLSPFLFLPIDTASEKSPPHLSLSLA